MKNSISVRPIRERNYTLQKNLSEGNKTVPFMFVRSKYDNLSKQFVQIFFFKLLFKKIRKLESSFKENTTTQMALVRTAITAALFPTLQSVTQISSIVCNF